MKGSLAILCCLFLSGPDGSAREGKTESLLARVKAVRQEGVGNSDASSAWRELVQLGPAAIIDILAAIDDNDAVSANWLRCAVDTISERAMNSGSVLPTGALEGFVTGTNQSGIARRVAYEWLAHADKTAPRRLLPGMLDDPSRELRRDAIEFGLVQARALPADSPKEQVIMAFQKLWIAARDQDQVEAITRELSERGVAVDLQRRFNFISKWLLLGPFDNTGGVGFDIAYPPEQSLNVQADFEGKNGEIRWNEYVTTDPYGVVDLNQALGKNMGAVGYAFVEVDSPLQQMVELRAGSDNAIKIFLNGKQIFFREEYHHGTRMDQHVGVGTLQEGSNRILVKVCQDEQTASFAQSWNFQLRVCDALGGAVPIQVLESRTPRESSR